MKEVEWGTSRRKGQHVQRPPVEGVLGELELQLEHGWSRVGGGEAGAAGQILMPQGWSHSGNYQMYQLTLEEPGSSLNSRARAPFTIRASKDKALGADPWAGSHIGRRI